MAIGNLEGQPEARRHLAADLDLVDHPLLGGIRDLERQPDRYESLTVRRALSRFGSSRAIDCQVPSVIRPPMIGTTSEGDARSGRT